jgi:hypothetical protein
MGRFNFMLPSIIFLTSCFAQEKSDVEINDLIGTTWSCKIVENCINEYSFKSDSTFSFFSCEMQDEYFGNFYFEDGFLMLDQKGSVHDKSFPETSRHRAKRRLYMVKIDKDSFVHLSMSEWENGNWIPSDFKFDEDYIYEKKE